MLNAKDLMAQVMDEKKTINNAIFQMAVKQIEEEVKEAMTYGDDSVVSTPREGVDPQQIIDYLQDRGYTVEAMPRFEKDSELTPTLTISWKFG